MNTDVEKNAPIIILSHPQMGENIGAAARVMRNFGLVELRLIAPRDGWPNENSTALAAGAFSQMEPVRVFESSLQAVADLQKVFAVTARMRDMEKPVLAPDRAANELYDIGVSGGRTGLLFGAEASGLSNGEVARCDAIVTYPVATDFCSLNLAQAVGVAAYAWRQCFEQKQKQKQQVRALGNPLASKLEIDNMLKHLQTELSAAGFFYPVEKTVVMMQNLQNLYARTSLTSQEVRTLRGVIKALAKGRGPTAGN